MSGLHFCVALSIVDYLLDGAPDLLMKFLCFIHRISGSPRRIICGADS